MDFYGHVRELARQLQLAGIDEAAQGLEDVTSDGSTGGEILMGVRYHLQILVQSRRAPEFDSQVEEILRYIDSLLP